MNNQPQKKPRLGGGSSKQRILMAVAGGGILLIVFGIIFGLLFNSGSSSTDTLVKLAADQTEIIRVAELGEKQAASIDAKNYASTVKLSMASASNQLKQLLDDRGRKLKPQELAAAKDEDTDKALTAASQANRFDAVFREAMDKALKAYQAKLRQLHHNASSTKEKQAIESIHNQTVNLSPTQ